METYLESVACCPLSFEPADVAVGQTKKETWTRQLKATELQDVLWLTPEADLKAALPWWSQQRLKGSPGPWELK